MKQFSLALNILLLAAVGFLYYKTFNGSNVNVSKVNGTQPIKLVDSNATNIKVAYVDLDSLNENIIFFKQKRKALEQLQRNNENELETDLKQLEAKQYSFREKNPNPTPEQFESFRAQLMKDQENIEVKKQRYSNNISQQNFEMVEKIRKELKDFFAVYNQQKKYQYIFTTSNNLEYLLYKDSSLNITSEVVKGMNEKLAVKQ
jgi:outer membrane protein